MVCYSGNRVGIFQERNSILPLYTRKTFHTSGTSFQQFAICLASSSVIKSALNRLSTLFVLNKRKITRILVSVFYLIPISLWGVEVVDSHLHATVGFVLIICVQHINQFDLHRLSDGKVFKDRVVNTAHWFADNLDLLGQNSSLDFLSLSPLWFVFIGCIKDADTRCLLLTGRKEISC